MVIKTSKSDDFIYQIKWFLELPSDLKKYIPEIYEYSLENKYIKMKYYPESSIDKYLIEKNYQIVNNALRFVDQILDDFSKYKVKSRIEDFYDMYYLKTYKRLAELAKIADRELKGILDSDYLIINNQKMYGIKKILEISKEYWPKLIEDEYTIIHGDLCLNNILKDSDKFLLIDPRGKFGDTFMYGDIKYEYAKISHSIFGGYDYIIHDKYSLRIDDLEYYLDFDLKYNSIPSLRNIRFDEFTKYIEAHLFLSMALLHMPSYKKVKAMIINGIRLFNEFLTHT